MANLQYSTFLTPNTETAINGQVDNIFTCLINANPGVAVVKYKIDIVLNSNNDSVYSQTVTLNSNNCVYDGETLSHTVPVNTLTNGIEYKWYITVYDSTDLATGVTSDEILLKLNSPINIVFTVPSIINAQKHTFTFTYLQTENIPIEYFKYNLYSNNKLIKTSGNLYGGRPSYEFTGFISNSEYEIEVVGVNVNGSEFSSGKQSFTVSYASANVSTKPNVSQDIETSLVTVDIGTIVQNTGVASGVYSFINNFITNLNKALHLNANSKVVWDVDIPSDFTTTIKIKKINSVGKIVELESSDGILYYVGHDGTAFYWQNGEHLAYGNTQPLPDKAFRIIIFPTEVWIKTEYGIDKIKYSQSSYSGQEATFMLDGYLYDSNNEKVYLKK